MTKASGQKQKRQQRKGAALQADSSQPQPRATSKEEEYTGYLIVHFQDGRVKFDVPGESLYAYAKNQGLGQLIDLLQSSTLDSPERSQRVIRDTSEQELREMEKAAMNSNFPPVQSLTGYWRIDVRDRKDEEVKALIEKMSKNETLYGFDEVYLEHNIILAAITADSLSGNQGYLDAAPNGIDARFTWTQTKGAGEGIHFADLERAWIQNHNDLPPSGMMPGHLNLLGLSLSDRPQNTSAQDIAEYANHGTAALGIVIAKNNGTGVVGIAPNVASVRLASSIRQIAGTNWSSNDLANRVVDVIRRSNSSCLLAGDILLLEVQQAGSNLPVETNPAEFHAIRLASALNVIVIEPAGNGFDEVILSTDPKKDSGAIMVGASHSGFPIGFNDRHARWVVPGSPPSEGSNFGARVNCYAWGENVATCGCGYQQPTCGNLSNAHQPETAFTNTFNGTSAASAIIAGAALVVQGLYADRNPGVRLSVSQMRDVLSNIGTLSVGNEIGKMPDLHKIYDHFNLNQVPDGFIRDAVGDIGQTPYQGGRLSISPDIIVRKSTPLGGDPIPNPMITFGPATENRDDLGSEVEFGQDNYVYVRMKNRGAAVTQTAKAKVYYAASSSLVMPDQWVEIGTTSSVIVPSGGGLVVTPGLLWPKAKLPPVGHYCFIAVLDGTSDPAPVLPTSSVNFGWPEFIDLIRNNNNVAWRNFNVVNNQPDVMGVMKFQFFIGGAPDHQTDFDFEILREGEGITHLWLDVPLAVAKQIGRFNKLDREDGRGDETAPDYSADSSVKENYARFRLSRSMTTRLNQVTLKAKAWYECFLVAETDKQMDESKGNNRVAIRQLYQNISVGQVTWQIQPKIKGSKQDAKSGKAVLTRPKREKNR